MILRLNGELQKTPKHTTLQDVEFGAAVKIIQDGQYLYVSRTGTTIGELVKLEKKTMVMVWVETLVAVFSN